MYAEPATITYPNPKQGHNIVLIDKEWNSVYLATD